LDNDGSFRHAFEFVAGESTKHGRTELYDDPATSTLENVDDLAREADLVTRDDLNLVPLFQARCR
jgi:hypothetical protein